MILNLLNLLTGFSLILLALAMLLNYIRFKKINPYFFLLLLFAGLSRFQFGLSALHLIHEDKPLVMRFFILLFLLPPVFFLCLQSFFSLKISFLKISLHFSSFFTIVLVRIYLGEVKLFYLGLFFVLYAIFYYILLIRSSVQYFKAHQSIYTRQQLFKVKQLIIWIFALSLNNFIFIAHSFLTNNSNRFVAIEAIFHSTIISWVLFLIYLFFNPGIIFNEVFKKKDPNRDFAKEFDIWSSKPLHKLDPQDRALEAITRKNMAKMLENLAKMKPDLIIESNSTKLIAEIAKHLNYPKSHLKFAIKYHCRFSQSDYLNLMRLIHALTLINNGYLENYTIETLGEHCHFNSRTSFYRHFKRHMGVSPSRYKTLIE
jgi:AraC-like DNA-binding protein